MLVFLLACLSLLPSIPLGEAANLYHTRGTPFNVFSYTFQDGQLATDGLPPPLARTAGGFSGYELQMNTMGGVEWKEERAGLKITGPDGGLKARSLDNLDTRCSGSCGGDWPSGQSSVGGYTYIYPNQFTLEFWISQPTYPAGEKRLIAGMGNWGAGQEFPECITNICSPFAKPPCAPAALQYGGWTLYSVGGDKIRFSTRIWYNADVSGTGKTQACAFLEVTLVPGVVNHVTIRAPGVNTSPADPKGFLVMNSTGTSSYFTYPRMYWDQSLWQNQQYNENDIKPYLGYVNFGLPTMAGGNGIMSWTGTLYSATLMAIYLNEAQITQLRNAGPPNSFPVVTVPSEPYLVNLTNTATPLPMLAMCSDFDGDTTRLVITPPSADDGTLFYNGSSTIPSIPTGDLFSFQPNATSRTFGDVIQLQVACADQGGTGRAKTIELRVTNGVPDLNATSFRTPFVYTGGGLNVTLSGYDRRGGHVTHVLLSSIPSGATLSEILSNGTRRVLSQDSIVSTTTSRVSGGLGFGSVTLELQTTPGLLGNGSLSPVPGGLVTFGYRSGGAGGVSAAEATVWTAVHWTHSATASTSTFLQDSSGISTLAGSDSLGNPLEYVISRLPLRGTLKDYLNPDSTSVTVGYAIPSSGRKIRFTYAFNATGDPFDTFGFYVRNPTTLARSPEANVTVRIRAVSGGANATFLDRGRDSTLALYAFQDGMRTWPTQPNLLSDWTGRNLMGTFRASTTGNLEWQRDTAGVRVASTAGGQSRLATMGTHNALWASDQSELTIELIFKIDSTTNPGSALVMGTGEFITTGLEPFNGTCSTEGWRIFYLRPPTGPRRFTMQMALRNGPSEPRRCVSLSVNVVNGQTYHSFIRVTPGSVEFQVGSTRVAEELPELSLDVSLWARSALHVTPLQGTSTTMLGTTYLVAFHDRYLFDDEVMIAQKIGIPPPLSRFEGPTLFTPVENVRTLLFNGSSVASFCSVPGSSVVPSIPPRGTLEFNGTHIFFTTGLFDLESTTFQISCVSYEFVGPPVTITLVPVQGPPVVMATSATVPAYAGVRRDYSLTGTVVHGGTLDSFTIKSLPALGTLRNRTTGVALTVGTYVARLGVLPLSFDPPLFVPEDHTGMALITTTSFAFGVSKNGESGPVSSELNGTITLNIMNPLHASPLQVSCTEDMDCAFSLSGFDELSQSPSAFRLSSIPLLGTLKNGTSLTPIGVTLSSGDLVYMPPLNAFGSSLASFSYVAWNESTQVMSSPETVTFSVSAVDDPYTLSLTSPTSPITIPSTSRSASASVVVAFGDVDTSSEVYDVTLSIPFPHDFTLSDPMLLQSADNSLGITRIAGFGIQSRETRFQAPMGVVKGLLEGPTKLYVPTGAYGATAFTVRVRSLSDNRVVSVQLGVNATGLNATDWVATTVVPVEEGGGSGIEMTTMDQANAGGGGGILKGPILYALIGGAVIGGLFLLWLVFG